MELNLKILGKCLNKLFLSEALEGGSRFEKRMLFAVREDWTISYVQLQSIMTTK